MSIVYRVNLNNSKVTAENLKDDYKFFGGRGLVAKTMTDEVNPVCDPLGKENKLIVSTGLLAGTTMPTAHRLSIGGKSPLTGGIKESNVGGTAATYLAGHNIKMIICEGAPQNDEWQLLHINPDSELKLLSAAGYVGLNNYELVGKLKEAFGDNVSVISIGVAGERLYKNSTLQVTDFSSGHPCRSAARGGMGSVMGSKKIKAIVIEKSKSKHKISFADKERFDNARKTYIDRVKNNPARKWVTEVGTPSLVDMMGAGAVMPTHNYSGGRFDKLESIGSKAFFKRLEVGGGKNGLPCQAGCILRCSNQINDSNGEMVTSGLEYETIALCGSNCDIGDMDAIVRIDRLCDDFGIDTIETGATIGVCMEAGKIRWGDADAAIGLIKEMMEGTDFGRLMGKGTYETGTALGVKRIPTAKKQAFAAYDPRNIKGVAVTFATTPMGADHTAGLTIGGGLNPGSKVGQVAASVEKQISSACMDNFMCMFGWGDAEAPDVIPEAMAGVYGGEWDLDKVIEIGKQTLLMEIDFNKSAGFTAEDDRLPEFLSVEPALATGNVFDITPEELAEAFNY